MWVLQFFFFRLFWLFEVYCISLWILGSTCPTTGKAVRILIGIALNIHKIWSSLLSSIIQSFHLQTRKLFLFIGLFLNFLQQQFEVFSMSLTFLLWHFFQLFHLFFFSKNPICPLLVNTGFCLLVFYLAILLIFFLLFYDTIMSVTSSFLSWMPFHLFLA